MLDNLDPKYETIIQELEEAYNKYTETREKIIAISLSPLYSVGCGAGLCMGGSILNIFIGLYSANLIADYIKIYHNDLHQKLPVEGLISYIANIQKFEECYIKLPKELREEWISAKNFPKLTEHLKVKYPEDIYNDPSSILEIVTIDNEIDTEEWVKLAGGFDHSLQNKSVALDDLSS